MTQKNSPEIFEDMQNFLRQEFKDNCEDQIEEINDNLEKLKDEKIADEVREKTVTDILRNIHSIKGKGGIFGFPIVSIVAHRLEDFMTSETIVQPGTARDIQVFVDTISFLVETDEAGAKSADIVRGLPRKFAIEDVKIPESDIEVMVIMPNSVQRKVVDSELLSCGFRVTNIASSMRGIEIAVHTKPDLVIVGALVDELSGVEIANIFKSIGVLKNIPFILLTSFTSASFNLKDLPDTVHVIHKDSSFADELSNTLIEVGLFGQT